MKDLQKLPTRDAEGALHVVVESPRGSTVKLKYDAKLGAFTISRPLVLGLRYPYDWGFVPSTKAADGDPLDAMILLDAPTFPGVVVPCRAVGIIKVEQKKSDGSGRERNDRLLCTPTVAPRFEDLLDARQLPERTRDEISQFFRAVVAFADKELQILGWGGPEEAEEMVKKSAL